jgi:simple sugar transport system permease protein
VNALRRAWRLLALPLVAIALSVLVGSIVIIASNWLVTGQIQPGLAIDAYAALIEGSIGSERAIVNTLVNTMPLLLGGLSVGLAFKGGLFNIGAQGQFMMGALGAVIVGVQLRESPAIVAIPASLAMGMLFGLVWGFIPGALKALSGAHEVVTTIMLNFVAIYLVSYVISGPLRGTGPEVTFARTDAIVAAELPIIIGRNGHLGLLFAAVAVPLAWWLLYRSTTGFEIRTTGASPDAARYAGMHPRWLIVLTMSMCGLLAGLAGAGEILGEVGYMPAFYGTTVGFDAIAVALLGRSHPVGVLLAGILFGALQAGGRQMQVAAGVSIDLIAIIQALIIVFIAAPMLVRTIVPWAFRSRAGGRAGAR